MFPALLLAALAVPQDAPARPLTVISFNLRFDNPSDPHPWPTRREGVLELMRTAQVIGTQEGLFHQVRDLEEGLGPGWDWIGLGREGGSRGEFMAIFYDRARFQAVAYDHFWLSDTPDVIGSSSWGNQVRRMVTWARLRERDGGQEFYVVNTHFDHRVAESRRKSAELLRARIADLDTDVPLIVTGDFNAAGDTSEPWKILVEESPLEDAWHVAQERHGEVATAHGWRDPRPGGSRIDWVLVRGVAGVSRAEALLDKPNGVWPSDHLPIRVTLALPQ